MVNGGFNNFVDPGFTVLFDRPAVSMTYVALLQSGKLSCIQLSCFATLLRCAKGVGKTVLRSFYCATQGSCQKVYCDDDHQQLSSKFVPCN